MFTCYPVSLCKQLVYSSTRSLVHLPCYPVFDTSNLFTRSLVYLSTYYVTLSLIQATRSHVYWFTCPLTLLLCLFRKQLVHSSTRSLVNLLCYPVFVTSNSFTCLLVHSSTNCLYLLNIKVNISIISI